MLLFIPVQYVKSEFLSPSNCFLFSFDGSCPMSFVFSFAPITCCLFSDIFVCGFKSVSVSFHAVINDSLLCYLYLVFLVNFLINNQLNSVLSQSLHPEV